MSHIEEFQHLKIQLEAIHVATNNFSDDNCIGGGGFGKVYKGELVHSMGKTVVALKRLDRESDQGNSEFWKEIMMLSFYKNENIVTLLGYCDDHDEKILVYEYASNNSLDKSLASNDLTWVKRLKICGGAACGLAYLHNPTDTQLRIVHRDVKSSNILLDDNWSAKISDFGLSKFAPANNQFTFLVTNPAGTSGYIDPMYHETGLLTKESDVYSFGVVLFEVLCGRLCIGNESLQPLIGLVREYYAQNKIHELVYSNIKDEINITSLKLFVDIAYRCLSRERKERPLMTEIVNIIVRAVYIQENPNGDAVFGDGTLHLRVLRTVSGRKNKFDVPNSYFILELGDGQKVKCGWDEVVTLYVENFHHQSLSIFVNKVESVQKHRYLGTASMELSVFPPEILMHWPLILWHRINSLDWYRGNLEIEVGYKPLHYYRFPSISRSIQNAPVVMPKDGGLLVIIIDGAHLYHEKHRHSSVTLRFRGEFRKTPSMMSTNKPIWRQEFTFMLEQPPKDEQLHFEVINNSWKGLIPGKGSLGCVDINLADVINKKWTYESYELKPGYNCGKKDGLGVKGAMMTWSFLQDGELETIFGSIGTLIVRLEN